MHVRLAILPSTPLDVHVRTTCHDPGTHSMMVTDHLPVAYIESSCFT